MKIQKVKITDYKCLHNIEQDVLGKNVILIGDNEVGKSSFIQFIEIALGADIKIPANGVVWADKDGNEYIFEVKPDKNGKNKVIIHTPDGMKDDRKGTLSNIVGAVSFDINAFVELSKTDKGRKEQVEIFKSMLPDEIREELVRLERNIQVNFDMRTETNRDVKRLEGAIKLSPIYNDTNRLDSFKHVNLDDVYAKLKEANEENQKISKTSLALANLKAEQDREIKELHELQIRVKNLQDSIHQREVRINEGDQWIKANKEKDTSAMEQQIKDAAEINRKADEAERLKKQMEELEKAKNDVGELTVVIDSSRQALLDTIKSMETSIPGLSYLDDGLYYQPEGRDEAIPVHPDSMSESTIMELGVKMQMASAGHKILFIERTESIGAKRWEYIQELARINGWQIIAEQVQRGQDKLVIELFS